MSTKAFLDDMDETEAMATELVTRINRVIALAAAATEVCTDREVWRKFVADGEDFQSIVEAGREALAEVAAFFEVEVPQ